MGIHRKILSHKNFTQIVAIEGWNEKSKKARTKKRKDASRRWHNEYYQFLLKFTAKMLKHGVDLLKEIPLVRSNRNQKVFSPIRDQRKATQGGGWGSETEAGWIIFNFPQLQRSDGK